MKKNHWIPVKTCKIALFAPILVIISLTVPALYGSEQLRSTPENCSASYLSRNMDQVLPCFLLEPDSSYRWQLIETRQESSGPAGKAEEVQVHSLHMDSLRWHTAEQDDVSTPVWKHRLTIYQPDRVQSTNALLYINGGTLYPLADQPDRKQAKNDDLDFARIAANTRSVVIDLKDVPNQHLSFNDGPPLKEDALIAYTWKRLLENPVQNYNWPLRLPMVKSTVRGMDTVQAFMKQNNVRLDNFVLAGGSKRGWTVWLTAAMDNRVAAIMPMVIDVLNVEMSMKHHYRSYKSWAPAVKDYYDLMPQLGSAAMAKLMQVEDPVHYNHLLTMPKYIINASGDDFFLPDSSRFYFEALKGDKWMRVLPDLRHYIVRMNSTLVTDTVESFYGAISEERPMPEVSWKARGNSLTVSSTIPPRQARLWTASNPSARDFRKTPDNPDVTDFQSRPLTIKCNSVCRIKADIGHTGKGWKASFIELRYANTPYQDLVFTTRVFVTPDVYPLPTAALKLD